MRTQPAPQSAIGLLDSAFTLLRQVPAIAWLWWSAGALPYALALLTLIAEMSSTSQLRERLAGRALLTAIAYIWMAATNAMFCLYLRRGLSGNSSAPRPPLLTIVGTQAFLQSTALLILPIAVLSMIAVPWAFAFYESASAFPYSAARVRLTDVYRYAAKEASRWPIANIGLQLMVAPFSLVVLLNTAIVVFGAPFLFRTMTGQESDFTRSPMALMNLTVSAAVCIITWLLLSPLFKAIYTIRCFQGDSIVSGADLRADLHRLAKPAAVLLAVVPSLFAQAVDPPQLDRAIRDVTQRPEYVWRSPQLATPDLSNPFVRFTEDAVRFIAENVAAVMHAIVRIVEAVVKWLLGDAPSGSMPDVPGVSPRAVEALMYVLLAITTLAVMGLVVQGIRKRRRIQAVTTVPTTPAIVDITADDVSPDLLPDSGWLELADQWTAQGDLRMATRAVFLALLAGLGTNGVITIDKAKSNLDYTREIRRRARGNNRLQDSFRACVTIFERTWYGRHDMPSELFDRFRNDALTARSNAQQA